MPIRPVATERLLTAVRPAWLTEVYAHARDTYPEECCGILTREPEGWLPADPAASRIRVHRCQNLQNRLHEGDPRLHPRSARTGYQLDPMDLLRVGRRARLSAATLAAVYHSHTDTGCSFSDLDRREAAPAGEPLLPDVAYLVVAIRAGVVRDAALYAWAPDLGAYVDAAIETLLEGAAAR